MRCRLFVNRFNDIFGIIRFTNNDGRARHSVCAAGWQPTRSAGSGLPALPAFSSWFVIWIIPKFLLGHKSCVKKLAWPIRIKKWKVKLSVPQKGPANPFSFATPDAAKKSSGGFGAAKRSRGSRPWQSRPKRSRYALLPAPAISPFPFSALVYYDMQETSRHRRCCIQVPR